MPRGTGDVAPCDRTDDTVHHQPVRLLEILHDLLRLGSEDSVDVVGSQAEGGSQVDGVKRGN